MNDNLESLALHVTFVEVLIIDFRNQQHIKKILMIKKLSNFLFLLILSIGCSNNKSVESQPNNDSINDSIPAVDTIYRDGREGDYEGYFEYDVEEESETEEEMSEADDDEFEIDYDYLGEEAFECSEELKNLLPNIDDFYDSSKEQQYNTPSEFRVKHPDEWLVIEMHNKLEYDRYSKEIYDSTYYAELDKLVKAYICKKNIEISSNKCRRLKQIEKICKRKFDISKYCYTTFHINYSIGLRGDFETYINWLYLQEANSLPNEKRFVDFKTEVEMFKNLNDAAYDMCDKIHLNSDGLTRGDFSDIQAKFERSLFKSTIGYSIEEQYAPEDIFLILLYECNLLIEEYDPNNYIGDDVLQDATPVVTEFRLAYNKWYKYRQSVASSITDYKIWTAYESLTCKYARIHLIHLKNRYNDIGMTSGSIEKICLKYDCSNEELVRYNYKQRFREEFGD